MNTLRPFKRAPWMVGGLLAITIAALPINWGASEAQGRSENPWIEVLPADLSRTGFPEELKPSPSEH